MKSNLWPSNLQNKINSIGTLETPILNYNQVTKIKEIEDVSEKANFLNRFFPNIKAVSYDIQKEALDKRWYTGIQYTLNETLDKKNRVLQILLIWTRQRAFMSRFFAMIFILISIISILQLSSIKPESQSWAEWSIVLISLYLLFYFIYYSITSLILWHVNFRLLIGIMGIVYYFSSHFDLTEKSNGNGFLFTLLDGVEIYISLTSIIFLLIAFIFLVLRFLENIGVLGFLYRLPVLSLGHDMDYAPLWVFLKKKHYSESVQDSEPFNWEISDIRYDRLHYFIGKVKVETEENEIQFEIRNRWHSFNISILTSLLSKKIKFFLIFLEIILFGIITGLLWGEISLIFLQTVIGIIIITTVVSLYNSYEFNFTEDFKEKSASNQISNILTPNKIDILWNLKDKKSRLKITDKLFNPFDCEWEKGKWDKESTNIFVYYIRKYLLFYLSDRFIKTTLFVQGIKKKLTNTS
ncbi:MAG: hypothetical protein ACW967_10630 [Candidatus Hodarchaeales archaeon]|jgi:hypothetical protein